MNSSRFPSANAVGLAGALTLALGAAPARAQPVKDIAGGKDNPVVSRFAGALMQNFFFDSYAEIPIPAGAGKIVDQKVTFEAGKSVAFAGKLDGYIYTAPKDKSPLEIFRNYQAALKQGGFTTLYTCELEACENTGIVNGYFGNQYISPRKWAGSSGLRDTLNGNNYFVSAKTSKGGQDIYVLLFVNTYGSNTGSQVLLVAQSQALQTGQVTVNAEALKKGLAADGKIALYGIYFDTGKAEIKPESKAQLDEMGKLFAATPTLKAFIVGHTDNVGNADANLALSKARADAVVAALVKEHKVDTKRLAARGVAGLSPVMSNAGEEGRGKNRRVELVEQ
jgi:OmpA-OmpF porin, OOP family